ncbi:MAG: hypothetical protein K8I82_24225 [Anaerolineae bacterium]|nr:hypothetical protein [Anaerolineae bacterium]
MMRAGCLMPLLMAIVAPFMMLFGISDSQTSTIVELPPTEVVAATWANFGSSANSSLTVNEAEVMLRVCSENLALYPLHVRMWRNAFGADYSARTWQFIVDTDGTLLEASYQDADTTEWITILDIEDGAWVEQEAGCITLRNMEGPGDTLEGVEYNTAAALDMPPSEDWPIPCYFATDGLGLCDTQSR